MKTLKIHYLQHVDFEDLGCIEQWVLQKRHILSSTKFFEDAKLPDISSFDWLIILGGPMGVNEQEKYVWLPEEKAFIKHAIEHHKTVIGICLGAQLIASALDAKVYPNKEKEIGWFPIEITARSSNLAINEENNFKVFHWHGDTFELPKNAIHIASSKACINQAFIYNNNVLGLQFHFEVTEKSLKEMINFGVAELNQGNYIQQAQDMLNEKELIKENNQRMFQLLNYLDAK